MTQYCVALIGGIGSGKSTVSHFFNELGIDVISADLIAKALSEQPKIKQKIKDLFGSDVFDDANILNRKALAQIVFHEPEKKKCLENILHPLVHKKISEEIKSSTAPYCLIEIPVFHQRKDFPYINRILCVQINTKKQIAQTVLRDNKSAQEVEQIIKQQLSYQERALLADDILNNNGTLEELNRHCLELHEKYLSFRTC